jgi:hypothetical protein
MSEAGVMVYDTQRREMVTVSPAEAAAGMVRYARSLGAGSPACGVYERRALEVSGRGWKSRRTA